VYVAIAIKIFFLQKSRGYRRMPDNRQSQER